MTSEIDKLKHFHIEDYSGIYFTDELNACEEFLYTTTYYRSAYNVSKRRK